MIKYNYNDMCNHLVTIGKSQVETLKKDLNNWEQMIEHFENCKREDDDDDWAKEYERRNDNPEDLLDEEGTSHALESEGRMDRNLKENTDFTASEIGHDMEPETYFNKSERLDNYNDYKEDHEYNFDEIKEEDYSNPFDENKDNSAKIDKPDDEVKNKEETEVSKLDPNIPK